MTALLLLALAADPGPPVFTVENRMPPTFQVVNNFAPAPPVHRAAPTGPICEGPNCQIPRSARVGPVLNHPGPFFPDVAPVQPSAGQAGGQCQAAPSSQRTRTGWYPGKLIVQRRCR